MAGKIQLRLYEELNDYLPSDKRKLRFACPVDDIRTIEELLDRLGVPQKDVELVLVNGASVPSTHPIREDDFVSLFPVFESLDIKPLLLIREEPLREIRFLTGAGLLRLAGYLRLLGFDTHFAESLTIEEAVQLTEVERKILLTRDSSLLKFRELSRIYFVRAVRPKAQLLEVLSRFDLFDVIHFSGLQPMLDRILKPKDSSK